VLIAFFPDHVFLQMLAQMCELARQTGALPRATTKITKARRWPAVVRLQSLR
jgi:hypothetical protein